jgi:integrase
MDSNHDKVIRVTYYPKRLMAYLRFSLENHKKTKIEGRPRTVCLSDNAIAWLKAYLARKQELHSPLTKWVIGLTDNQLQNARSTVFRQVAGHDAEYIRADLRHTYASNHLAEHGDISSLVRQLGHAGDANMLWNHYHREVSKADAEAFWQIMPPS